MEGLWAKLVCDNMSVCVQRLYFFSFVQKFLKGVQGGTFSQKVPPCILFKKHTNEKADLVYKSAFFVLGLLVIKRPS